MRAAVVGFGAGVGTGIAWTDARHLFEGSSPLMISPFRVSSSAPATSSDSTNANANANANTAPAETHGHGDTASTPTEQK